eukprot:TRINITY_DN24382_c0_g1_i2.p1 TRINITY_DN24382_c0_g1~~TRINITY_DN24382_c0_g1_i2.p1  ORF type:complete len:508 (-),score=59.95 TRINITY_DN24382_c0_g1_i2:129-1472(-)
MDTQRSERYATPWRQQRRRPVPASAEHYALLEAGQALDDVSDKPLEARPSPCDRLGVAIVAPQLYDCDFERDSDDSPLAPNLPMAVSDIHIDGTSPGQAEESWNEADLGRCEVGGSSSSSARVVATSTPLQAPTISVQRMHPPPRATQTEAAAAAANTAVESAISAESRKRLARTGSAASLQTPSTPSACREVEMEESSKLVISNDADGLDEDRTCFICLMEEDRENDNPLMPCCSTCYASVHKRCWREWRNNQRVTALRSRLLGLRAQTNNLLRCSICKSGTAVVAGEEDGLEWMNELLCGGETGAVPGQDARTIALARLARRTDDSDEDRDAQLEDFIDGRTFGALALYLAVLIIVLIMACTLIVMQRFYAGDVVLCCIIALYELSVLQVVVLAITRRRAARLAASAVAAGNSAVTAAVHAATSVTGGRGESPESLSASATLAEP